MINKHADLHVLRGPALPELCVAEDLLPPAPPKGHQPLLDAEELVSVPGAVLDVSLLLHVVLVLFPPVGARLARFAASGFEALQLILNS